MSISFCRIFVLMMGAVTLLFGACEKHSPYQTIPGYAEKVAAEKAGKEPADAGH